MTWNYRIIRKTQRYHGRATRYYDIHEVFYDKNGKPDSWSEDAVDANSVSTVRELQTSLSRMLCDSLKHPVLEIVGKGKRCRLVERK